MSNWAIVAIPQADDPVWKYSSEKVPHMTLLFLGDQSNNPNQIQMAEFIAHVVHTSMFPFGMSVDSRGPLGPDNADVLFFANDKHGRAMITTARNYFLTDPSIMAAYNSTEQYSSWTPHLTMGYPTSPARVDDREYSGFNYVQFDRIALWTDDYSGPTFQLHSHDTEVSDMAMNDPVGSFLSHFGVKGMHWGQRKDAPSVNTKAVVVKKNEPAAKVVGFTKQGQYNKANADTAVTVVHRPGSRLSTQGGSNRKPHPDAIRTAANKRIAKSSTTDALSTKELQELVGRMNLEQQYSKLTSTPDSATKKFLKEMLWDPAKQQGKKVANNQAEQYLVSKGLLPKKESNEERQAREKKEKEAAGH